MASGAPVNALSESSTSSASSASKIQDLVNEFFHTLNGSSQSSAENESMQASLRSLIDTIYNEGGLDTSKSVDTTINASKHNNVTIPQEFKFHLDKRKPENRHEELVYLKQKETLQECTFHPHITELPPQYSRSKLDNFVQQPFLERVMKWKEQKEMEIMKKNQEVSKTKLQGCTFKPSINPLSTSIDTSTLSGSFNEEGNTVHMKLYQSSLVKKQRKEEEAEKIKEEVFKQQCTFKPQLVANKSPVAPRYMIPKPQQQEVSQEKECTFAPTINKLNKRFSSGSQLYLQTNAFERLSRSKNPNDSSLSTSTSSKDDSFASSTDSPLAQKVQKRPASAQSRLSEASVNVSTEKSFGAFLERQENILKKKQEKITHIKSATEPAYKPNINKKSAEIMKSTKYSFMDRLKAQQEAGRQQKEKPGDCTFKPQINKQSKKMQGRSAEQMSKGDYEIYMAKRMMALKAKEEAELKEATFKPKTNNTNARSYLSVMTDPNTYMQMVHSKQQKLEEKRRNHQAAREQQELEKCTFKPEVHEAPEYVKRIAKSMAIAKENSPPPSPQRPEWR